MLTFTEHSYIHQISPTLPNSPTFTQHSYLHLTFLSLPKIHLAFSPSLNIPTFTNHSLLSPNIPNFHQAFSPSPTFLHSPSILTFTEHSYLADISYNLPYSLFCSSCHSLCESCHLCLDIHLVSA